MSERIVIDANLTREGMHQFMRMYTDNGYIQLSGTPESYMRVALMMGIHEIAIYVCDNYKGIDMKLALQMKQDMLDCYSLDHATKRGRKPKLTIRIIDPVTGKDV